MRLKLDENLPTGLAAGLATRDHDADTVIDEGPAGQPDPVIVATAADARRMLLTLDRGIGDLRRYPPGSHAGVVVLRPASQDPASVSTSSTDSSKRTTLMTSRVAWSSSSPAASGSDAQNSRGERYRAVARHPRPTPLPRLGGSATCRDACGSTPPARPVR